MSKRDRLYNYIVNTFGISKEMMYKYVHERLDDLVAKHLKSKIESNYVEKLILDKVTQVMKNGFKDGGYLQRDEFESWFKNTVERMVKEKVFTEYKIIIEPKKVTDMRSACE